MKVDQVPLIAQDRCHWMFSNDTEDRLPDSVPPLKKNPPFQICR